MRKEGIEMQLYNNLILEVPYDIDLEVKLIDCFLDKGFQILVPVIIPNDEDIEKIKFYKEKFKSAGVEMSTEKEGFFSGKEPAFVCVSSVFKLIQVNRTVEWYMLETRTELLQYLESTPIGYRLCIVEEGRDISKYDSFLEMYEHCMIDERDETECRGLTMDIKNRERFETIVLPSIIKFIDSVG